MYGACDLFASSSYLQGFRITLLEAIASEKPVVALNEDGATLSPNGVFLCKGIDVAWFGEGEYPFLEIVNALEDGKETRHITNLWVKENGVVTGNPLRPLISNIDELPFPDREIFH